jgi:hypothetical protein
MPQSSGNGLRILLGEMFLDERALDATQEPGTPSEYSDADQIMKASAFGR